MPNPIWTPEEIDRIAYASPSERWRWNIEAIRTLKLLEAENRPATPEEQAVLARWTGFGDSAFNRHFNEETPQRKELQELLTPEEFKSIERARINAYYTPAWLVRAMWKALMNLGLQDIPNPRILEPAAGVGRFLGLMPKEIATQANTKAVELDEISGRILSKLFPDTDVHITGFQSASIPDNWADVVITNVPFGNISVYDPTYIGTPKEVFTKSIHNYFIGKALDKVRPGGVVAVITSRYTMDGTDSQAVRRLLNNEADLLFALRIPRGLFPDTEVVADILFLRKRLPTEKPIRESFPDGGYTDWTIASELPLGQRLPVVNEQGDTVGKDEPYGVGKINAYYQSHPDHVIGQHAILSHGMYRSGEYSVLPPQGVDVRQLVENTLERLGAERPKWFRPINRYDGWTPTVERQNRMLYKAREGAVGDVVLEGDKVVGVIQKVDGIPWVVRLKRDDEDFVRSLLPLYTALQEVMNTQLRGEDDAIVAQKQETLRHEYLKWVRKHGLLHSHANRKRLTDPEVAWNGGPLLLALEDPSEVRGLQRKGSKELTEGDLRRVMMPIFYTRVLKGHKPTKPNTPAEALLQSLAEKGTIDWDWMANLLGLPKGDIQQELLEQGLVFRLPEGGWETRERYLSGNVRRKLQEAEEAARRNPAFLPNVEALRAVQPPDVGPEDISAPLGAPWIPENYMNRFLAEKAGIRTSSFPSNRFFTYSDVLGAWVKGNNWDLRQLTDSYSSYKLAQAIGLPRAKVAIGMDDFVLKVLNGSPLVVYRKVQTGDKEVSVVDHETTAVLQTAATRLQAEWQNWLWKDPERAKETVRRYNELFNNTVPPRYDGSHLTLANMSPIWASKIRPYQKNAVWRVIRDGTALLAHEVGTGKTLTLATSAMELRRLGLARKVMIVVPKHLQDQWVKDFRMYYPLAKILAPEPHEFSKANRQEMLARIATGDWDAIIVTPEQFLRIPVHMETIRRFYEAQMAMLEQAIHEARGKRDLSHKELQKALERVKNRFERLLSDASKHQESTLTFEEMGIDYLFVDEADMYKNLWFKTNMGRIKGLPNSDSQRAFDMFMKVRTLQRNGGKGVVFATGTPVSNTIAELYTMMRYLQPMTLSERGLDNFDAWANTFGTVTTDIEQTVTGDYKATQRFAKFQNIPELSNLWQERADIVTQKDVPDLRLPRLVDEHGQPKRTVVKCPSYPALERFMLSLAKRAESLSMVDPSVDNMLKIATDARKASLDIRMVKPGEPESQESKLEIASRKIAEIYHQTADKKGTQLVFLDMGVPQSRDTESTIKPIAGGQGEGEEGGEEEGVIVLKEDEEALRDVYGELRRKLVSKGIPDEEIVFIHHIRKNDERERLREDMNAGKVRVLIGSTAKMGTGLNVQKRLVALHHLDAPWRPRDVQQREGRILRPGNEYFNDGVRIYAYVTERSFDAFMWQAIEGKARAIASIMSRNPRQRTLTDIDTLAMSAAEAKALASGNPFVLKWVNAKNRLQRLEALAKAHAETQRQYQKMAEKLPQEIEKLRKRMESLEKDSLLAERYLQQRERAKEQKMPGFNMQVGDVTYTERARAGEALVEVLQRVPKGKGGEPTLIAHFAGFNIGATHEMEGSEHWYGIYIISPVSGATYSAFGIPRGELSPSGLMTRLENKLRQLSAQYAATRQEMERLQDMLENAQKNLGKAFAEEQELARLREEVAELEKKVTGHTSVNEEEWRKAETEVLQEIAESSTAERVGVVPAPTGETLKVGDVSTVAVRQPPTAEPTLAPRVEPTLVQQTEETVLQPPQTLPQAEEQPARPPSPAEEQKEKPAPQGEVPRVEEMLQRETQPAQLTPMVKQEEALEAPSLTQLTEVRPSERLEQGQEEETLQTIEPTPAPPPATEPTSAEQAMVGPLSSETEERPTSPLSPAEAQKETQSAKPAKKKARTASSETQSSTAFSSTDADALVAFIQMQLERASHRAVVSRTKSPNLTASTRRKPAQKQQKQPGVKVVLRKVMAIFAPGGVAFTRVRKKKVGRRGKVKGI